eukprot:CAMPEP_0167809010 /NCGR_PEP_ID=MMETSP0111_2-20121227/23537_1 /TAXON_ID=91324 /ORGANISM="Lotharella globosa, Strain CCCM811" /LENGTH=31 /DNA_ID= /DNA_START= /DNA_END= /DNA_ORIENTATION=
MDVLRLVLRPLAYLLKSTLLSGSVLALYTYA